MSSRWRRPSALLLALLLARSAALGAGAAAATAASQCSGTTSPNCKGWHSGCSTSSDLSAAECSAWVDLYDKAGGAGWTACSQYRLDPCACNNGYGNGVECQNSQITWMYARAARTPRSLRARSRRPLSLPPRARPPARKGALVRA